MLIEKPTVQSGKVGTEGVKYVCLRLAQMGSNELGLPLVAELAILVANVKAH